MSTYNTGRKYVVNTKFECLKPKTFRSMSQNTNNAKLIGVRVPRLGNWFFNTETHTMTQVVYGENRLAKLTGKLDAINVWYAVGLSV